jgi:hypothetical protein
MKQRLVTAMITGVIGALGGVGVAIWQGMTDHMLGIALTTSIVAFFLGLVFKIRVK